MKTQIMKAQKEHRTLGIDPGLINTGWAIVVDKAHPTLLCGGTICPPTKASLEERLAILGQAILAILKREEPQDCCVENLFIDAKASTKAILQLGRAQGVILMFCGQMTMDCFFYQPTTIKKVITNSGHASKGQMGKMLPFFLEKNPETLHMLKQASEHQNDAIAVALCHLRHRKSPLFQKQKHR